MSDGIEVIGVSEGADVIEVPMSDTIEVISNDGSIDVIEVLAYDDYPTYSTTFASADLTAGILSVTHGVGTLYPGNMSVYKNTGERLVMFPVDAVDVDGNPNNYRLDFDFSEFGSFSGWHLSIGK